MATKKAKTTKRLTRGKKLEATKPLKSAAAPNLYNATATGSHIPKGSLT